MNWKETPEEREMARDMLMSSDIERSDVSEWFCKRLSTSGLHGEVYTV